MPFDTVPESQGGVVHKSRLVIAPRKPKIEHHAGCVRPIRSRTSVGNGLCHIPLRDWCHQTSSRREASKRVIRVLVVEDHHIVRAGVVALLSMVDDFEVVGQARDGSEAIAQFRLHSPDVTLIDLRLPGKSGIDVVKDLRRKSERARFVVLTAHGGEEEVYRAVQAGANAYLLKGGTHDELIRTIRSVCEGKSHYPVEIAETLARRLSAEGLTPREEEVVEKIVMGMGNKRIAKILGISESTVKVHVNNLFKKLNVTDRTQAAIAAIRRGIVTLEC